MCHTYTTYTFCYKEHFSEATIYLNEEEYVKKLGAWTLWLPHQSGKTSIVFCIKIPIKRLRQLFDFV